MSQIWTNWLDAATAPQATEPEEIYGSYRLALQVSATGSPTQAVVDLEGSLDGETWSSVLSLDAAGSAKYNSTFPGALRFIRLRLASLTGGTAPTVSATAMAAPLTEI